MKNTIDLSTKEKQEFENRLIECRILDPDGRFSQIFEKNLKSFNDFGIADGIVKEAGPEFTKSIFLGLTVMIHNPSANKESIFHMVNLLSIRASIGMIPIEFFDVFFRWLDYVTPKE